MARKKNDCARPSCPAMDKLVGQQIDVLDSGFVRVVDYMGTDESIVQAARVSYGSGTKKVHEDRGLIRYLMRHRHTTPFEMCEIKLHVRVPMDCWRQWIRHRTASVNEYSTRYSIAIDAAQTTKPDNWRRQSMGNRQGSSDALPLTAGVSLTRRESEFHTFAREVYDDRLNQGVAREQARKDLPLSTYTEAYWKIDLHNLFHFLSLRMDAHAQEEIRAYANIIGATIVSKWCPIAWEAFVDYRLNATSLSQLEVEVAKAVVSGQSEVAKKLARAYGWLKRGTKGIARNREREECERKLQSMGILVPWIDSD